MNACPCCKRPFRTGANNPSSKKLEQDRERAQAAIDVLRNFIGRGGFAGEPDAGNKLRVKAAQDEILRLSLAQEKPEMLWRIYRRADKGVSYVKPALKKAA